MIREEREGQGAQGMAKGSDANLSAVGTQRPKSSESGRGAVAHVRSHLFSPFAIPQSPLPLDHAPPVSMLRAEKEDYFYRREKRNVSTPCFFFCAVGGPFPQPLLVFMGGVPPAHIGWPLPLAPGCGLLAARLIGW